MTKRLASVLLGLAVLGGSEAQAQKVEVTPFYGYQFGGGHDVVRGRLSIPSSGSYGFTFDVRVRDDARSSSSTFDKTPS